MNTDYFEAQVRVFDQKLVDFVLPWPESKGIRQHAVPSPWISDMFKERNENPVFPQKISLTSHENSDAISGLYIYRDGIRILPYGDVDIDWLEMEKRQKFRCRILFLFVSPNHRGDSSHPGKRIGGLQEKAGREGFRDNKAYREFQAILKNFFIQLAAEFFRDDAPQGEQYTKG